MFVQQVVGKELQTFLEFPPMQRGASFNLDAVKAEMAKRMAQAEAASQGPGQLSDEPGHGWPDGLRAREHGPRELAAARIDAFNNRFIDQPNGRSDALTCIHPLAERPRHSMCFAWEFCAACPMFRHSFGQHIYALGSARGRLRADRVRGFVVDRRNT